MPQHLTSGSLCERALFVSSGTLTIPVRAASPDAWYDTRDYYGVTLSPAIAQYLDACVARFGLVRSVTQVRILCCCPSLAPQQQSAVRNLLEQHFVWRTACVKRSLASLGAIFALLALCCTVLILLCFAQTGAVSTLAAAAFAAFLGAVLVCLAKLCTVAREAAVCAKLKSARIEFKVQS